MAYRPNPTFDDFSKLVIDCINDEPFFRKDVLIPKVRALMAGFNVNVNTANYNRKESKSDAAKRLRALEQKQHEIKFWLNIVRELSTDEEMEKYYLQQEAMLVTKGFKEAGGVYK